MLENVIIRTLPKEVSLYLLVCIVKLLLKRAADRFTEKRNETALYEDQVVFELLHWFKREFFKWVNNPPCTSCGSSETKCIGKML